MTFTNPDQMARTVQCECNGAMFKKGVKQMLGFIFAMDGEVYRRLTWHARMELLREEMDCGYIREFDEKRINMTGLSPVEVNGECAGLRVQVEMLLGHSDELWAVFAKYGRDDQCYTEVGVNRLAPGLNERLTTSQNKAQRSIAYCKDVIWAECCSMALYEKRYNQHAISKRHGNISQPTVSRDLTIVKEHLSDILAVAYRKIEKKFKDGAVLP